MGLEADYPEIDWQGQPTPVCTTCDMSPVRSAGECRQCYDYRRRTGRPRPRALAKKLAYRERRITPAMMAKVLADII